MRLATLPELRGQSFEDRLMKRIGELDAADMARDPADSSFERLETIELDPDSLAHRGPLDQLDLATIGRRIDQSDPERVQAGTPDSDLGIQAQTAAAPRLRHMSIA